MQLFKCSYCGQPLYYGNSFCVKCQASLGFDPQQMTLLALKEDAGGGYSIRTRSRKAAAPGRYKYCVNQQHHVCNWLLPYDSAAQYCIACNLNRTIPDISQPDYREKWANIETAKHRLVYSLLRLKLPLISKFQDEEQGLAFDFKADEPQEGAGRLLTGHDNGLITLNIDEADDVVRVMARRQMDEVYRTVLGHFRHETGHYYWERLIMGTARMEPFRRLFGDETADYAEALNRHYSQGPLPDWNEHFISAYASAHPWEDWAETWAHYIHIVDTLETGYSYGLKIHPAAAAPAYKMSARLDIDPYDTPSFGEIIERWIPLTFVMNSLNRSMGLKDSYPFVITAPVKEKLDFIHNTIRAMRIND